MIPKTIHYCWFGKNPLSQKEKRCINSWKKYCPDYEIIEWNEDNYDITKNRYMSDAYKEKKWAFVSDYARLDVIYQNGGIYLDTDVELLRPLDELLNDKLFCGFECRDPLMDRNNIAYEESVNFGLGYGAEKEHPIILDILNFYEGISFYNKDGSLNLLACPVYQTKVLKKYGLVANRKTQRFDGGIAYSQEYFSPKSNLTSEMICLTNNSYSIHHFEGSWSQFKNQKKIKKILNKIFNYRTSDMLSRVIFIPIKLIKRII